MKLTWRVKKITFSGMTKCVSSEYKSNLSQTCFFSIIREYYHYFVFNDWTINLLSLKVKVVPACTIKAYGVLEVSPHLILTHFARWTWVVSFRSWPLYPCGKCSRRHRLGDGADSTTGFPQSRRVKYLFSAGNIYKVLRIQPYAYYTNPDTSKISIFLSNFSTPRFNDISCRFLNFYHGYGTTKFAQNP